MKKLTIVSLLGLLVLGVLGLNLVMGCSVTAGATTTTVADTTTTTAASATTTTTVAATTTTTAAATTTTTTTTTSTTTSTAVVYSISGTITDYLGAGSNYAITIIIGDDLGVDDIEVTEEVLAITGSQTAYSYIMPSAGNYSVIVTDSENIGVGSYIGSTGWTGTASVPVASYIQDLSVNIASIEVNGPETGQDISLHEVVYSQPVLTFSATWPADAPEIEELRYVIYDVNNISGPGDLFSDETEEAAEAGGAATPGETTTFNLYEAYSGTYYVVISDAHILNEETVQVGTRIGTYGWTENSTITLASHNQTGGAFWTNIASFEYDGVTPVDLGFIDMHNVVN